MKSREELKEIARQILDYRRTDHAQIMGSLNEEELRAITPLFEEVTKEQIERERAEHETFIRREREKDRKLSRRRKTSSTFFPFSLGEA